MSENIFLEDATDIISEVISKHTRTTKQLYTTHTHVRLAIPAPRYSRSETRGGPP